MISFSVYIIDYTIRTNKTWKCSFTFRKIINYFMIQSHKEPRKDQRHLDCNSLSHLYRCCKWYSGRFRAVFHCSWTFPQKNIVLEREAATLIGGLWLQLPARLDSVSWFAWGESALTELRNVAIDKQNIVWM